MNQHVRIVATFVLAIAVVGVWAGVPAAIQQPPGGVPVRPAPTPDNRADAGQLAQWMTQLSNWRRWGPDDELGALNLITPDKRRRAAALVRSGVSFSLARQHQIVEGATNNPFSMRASSSAGGFATDRLEIGFHGTTITHVDALCHFSFDGKTYNGYVFAEVVTKEGGCSKLGIGNVRDRLVTRAVLLDIPRLKGTPYLEPGTHVYREDIEAWEKQAKVRIEPGDAILLRTGRWAHDAVKGVSTTPSGFDLSTVPLFKERDIAIIGSDWTHDVGTVAGAQFAVHRFAIVALGITLFDNVDLEALAAHAAAQKQWAFMLVATPTSASNGTGAPVNPVAIF